MTERKKIVIGTRGSKLALWQAEWVRSQLIGLYPNLEVGLEKIKTTGDKILDVPLAKVGGKGLFVKEIEEALLRGDVDLAVHSMKDVPTAFPDNLHLAVMCRREDPRDALIAPVRLPGAGSAEHAAAAGSFGDLRRGATVGTSSLRRSCQLLSLRPDLGIAQLRGNLDTRIRKLDEGQFDAIILAAAGVKRLGWASRITEILDPEICLPAIGQGAVGIECRRDDSFMNDLLAPLNHPETFVCVSAERAFLGRLEGGCQVPIAAHARLNGRTLVLKGLVGSVTGDRIIRGESSGFQSDAAALGVKLAEEMLSKGAWDILREVYTTVLPPVDGEAAS